MRYLDKVSLVCVDCVNYELAIRALKKCNEKMRFKNVILFTDNKNIEVPNFVHLIIINRLNTIQEYSAFIFLNLANYITTEFALVCQHDGYIINPDLWDDEFLNYDYIGAPWWYEEKNVGNGGFSLRSKRLLKVLQYEKSFTRVHPEDDSICRFYHDKLVNDFGIRFAPESVAAKFSWEGNGKYPAFKNDTFGFHGGYL